MYYGDVITSMKFELFLITGSKVIDICYPREKKLTGDIIGHIELKQMPKIKSIIEFKKKKYKIESIFILNDDRGKRLELSKAGVFNGNG